MKNSGIFLKDSTHRQFDLGKFLNFDKVKPAFRGGAGFWATMRKNKKNLIDWLPFYGGVLHNTQ